MSAPQTNIERQQRRHRGPLVGMALGLAVVALLFIGYMIYEFSQGDGIEGADATIDSRSGEVEEVEDVEPAATN